MSLPNLLKAASIFAMSTGALDIMLGINSIQAFNSQAAPLPSTLPIYAVADSQFRYLGSAWAAFGMVLWWVSGDVRARRTPLRLLMAGMAAGGLGRVLSALKYGIAASPVFLGAPSWWSSRCRRPCAWLFSQQEIPKRK